MRSHRNEQGHILLVVPSDVIGPFRNALQKMAGGIDFFALDDEERQTLDQALRHLWNPGDDAQARDKTVPIDVMALAMRERSDLEPGDVPPPRTAPAASGPRTASVLTRIPTRERAAAPPPPAEDLRPTVELRREPPAGTDRSAARGPDGGYRAPSKGRHTDVSR
ncbi:MAG: hypothetical protein R3B48_23065 [Kofleriaceae bacterium]